MAACATYSTHPSAGSGSPGTPPCRWRPSCPLDRAVRVLGRRRGADGRLGRCAVPRCGDPGHPVAGQRAPADGERRARHGRCRRRTPRSPGCPPLHKLRTVATDPMTWRDLGWMLMAITVGFVISLLVVVLLLRDRHLVDLVLRGRSADAAAVDPRPAAALPRRHRAAGAPRRAAHRDPRRRRRPLGRRAAPARARPARRRAGPAGGAVAEPRHGRLDLREGPGRRAQAGQRRPRDHRRRARRAPLGGARHPSAGARRPWAQWGGTGAGAGHGGAGPGRGRPLRTPARPGRVGRLLRGRGVPGQRRQARTRGERLDPARPRRRRAAGRGR